MGVLKKVNGAVTSGVVVVGVAAVGCGFLALNIFQHGTKKREVIVTIKSAI